MNTIARTLSKAVAKFRGLADGFDCAAADKFRDPLHRRLNENRKANNECEETETGLRNDARRS